MATPNYKPRHAEHPEGEPASPEHEVVEIGRSKKLEKGGESRVSFSENPLATVEDEESGTRQELFALAGAEGSQFGVVRCTVGGEQFEVLARLADRGEAKLAGVFTGESYENNISTGGGFLASEEDPTFSRNVKATFSIQNGEVSIKNNNEQPLTATEARTSERSRLEPEEAAVRGLGKVYRARHAAEEQENHWALPLEELAEAASHKRAYDTVAASEESTAFGKRDIESLIARAKEPGMNEQAADILLTGELNGRKVTTEGLYSLAEQREYLAGIAKRSAETATILAEGEVAAMHGGRSSVLGSMLEFSGGLQSAASLKESEDKGFLVRGGDSHSTGAAVNEQIAFAALTDKGMNWVLNNYAGAGSSRERSLDDLRKEKHQFESVAASGKESERNTERAKIFAGQLDQAIQYITDNPDSDYARLMLDDFPVVFGASREAIFTPDAGQTPDRGKFYGAKDLHEVTPQRREIPLEGGLPVIGVPRDRVDMVQDMLKRRGFSSKVVPIEALATSR